jgi:hypothetical protein
VADEADRAADAEVEAVDDFVLIPWLLDPPALLAEVALAVTWNGAEKMCGFEKSF